MISTGMTETIRGQTNAYIQDKNVKPAIISLTSDSGQIYRRKHPVNKDVTLQTRLTVHPTETGLVSWTTTTDRKHNNTRPWKDNNNRTSNQNKHLNKKKNKKTHIILYLYFFALGSRICSYYTEYLESYYLYFL